MQTPGATRKILNSVAVPIHELSTPLKRFPKLGVVIHMYYSELALEFRDSLKFLTGPTDLFISVPSERAKTSVSQIFFRLAKWNCDNPDCTEPWARYRS